MNLYTLKPVYQERVWGGQNLHTLFNRDLPEGKKIGESWELVDRPEAQTLIQELNCTLHELWTGPEKRKFFGTKAPDVERFPILIKLLDSAEDLSVQVHPPIDMATKLGGESKTELWYVLHHEQDAKIYAGLKKGMDRNGFEQNIRDKKVPTSIHALKTKLRETMFIPSGRLHALGSGNVVLEVQQNSDTTYRVYDWDRVGLDGKPRELHLEQALACINFADQEPTFLQPHANRLIATPYFEVRRVELFEQDTTEIMIDARSFYYLMVSQGKVQMAGREWTMGGAVLIPANAGAIELTGVTDFAEVVIVSF